jgi:hypothetical protein
MRPPGEIAFPPARIGFFPFNPSLLKRRAGASRDEDMQVSGKIRNQRPMLGHKRKWIAASSAPQ